MGNVREFASHVRLRCGAEEVVTCEWKATKLIRLNKKWWKSERSHNIKILLKEKLCRNTEWLSSLVTDGGWWSVACLQQQQQLQSETIPRIRLFLTYTQNIDYDVKWKKKK